jgi:hypothetical protein
MMMIANRRFASPCSKARSHGGLALLMLGLALTASAQKATIITFDAPGADTKPGDNNGTYCNAPLK